MKTAIYLRKSRAEELNDSVDETLKRHKDTLLNFSKQQNLDIIEIYEEVISGENLYTRVEMLRLLQDVEKGLFDAVLCMDIDRLGRGAMSQQGVILETFKNADTKIITPRKVYDLNNELDEEYTEFQTFFARREFKVINRRMRQGINKTIEEGGYIANAPYGYQKCRINKLPSLEIIEEEANFVKIIFDMYVNKGVGCSTIATAISASGAVPKRGSKFNRTTIMKIIKNDVYIGKVTWNKAKHIKPKSPTEKTKTVMNDKDVWVTHDGLHPPIIDTETFENAQKIAAGRYHVPFNNGTLVNSLAGLIYCSNCESKLQYRSYNKTPAQPAHLLCTNKGCIKATQYRYVEKGLLESINQQLCELEISVQSKEYTKQDNGYAVALSNIDKEIAQITAQKNSLHDLLEQGVYSIETFVERNTLLEKKLAKLQETRTLMQDKLNDMNGKDINAIITRAKEVLQAYDSASLNDRNGLLKSIIEKVTYYKEPTWKSNQFTLSVKLIGI